MGDPYKEVRDQLAVARSMLLMSTPLTDVSRGQVLEVEHALDPQHEDWQGDAGMVRRTLEVLADELTKDKFKRPRPAAAPDGVPLEQSPQLEPLQGVKQAILNIQRAIELLLKLEESRDV